VPSPEDLAGGKVPQDRPEYQVHEALALALVPEIILLEILLLLGL
jgi:hypothetical protein